MKFICPSCKAKYQVADDKVAGRSVRMKCRKCGAMIHLSQSTAEAGVASDLPPPVAPRAASTTDRSAPKPRGLTPASAPSASTLPSRPTAAGRSGPGVPRAGTAPSRTAPAARAPAPRATPGSRPGGAPPSRPGGAPLSRPGAAPPPRRATGSAALPTAGGKLGTAAVGSASRAARPLGQGVGRAAASAAQAEPAIVDVDDEQTVVASSALAGAFSSALHGGPMRESMVPGTTEEWYVGINGTPVGPLRLSELRSKAAAGAVTKESLVWKEGFEEWAALKTFPELVAIVEESVSSVRASEGPLTGAAPKATQAKPAEAAAPAAGPVSGVTPAVREVPPAAAAVVPDPFAAPAPTPAPSPATTGAALVTTADPDVDLAFKRRSKAPAAAWLAVGVAVLFGFTIGKVVFDKDAPPESAKEDVEAPAQVKPAPSVASLEDAVPPPPKDEPEAAPSKQPGAVAATNPRAPARTPSAPAQPAAEPVKGLKGLSGLSAGPQAGPGPSNTAPAAGGQSLDSSAVQQTVSRYTGSVKRRCWQPALDTRTKDAPTSARVTATIQVSPSGGVRSVSTSGDPRGYRGLANCISSSIRAWQFPASSGSTTVNVPFVFAAQ